MRTIAALVLAATVWAGAQLVTAPAADPGICREFNNGLVVCAPSASPGGAGLDHLWEDGSARYSDGSVYDPASLPSWAQPATV